MIYRSDFKGAERMYQRALAADPRHFYEFRCALCSCVLSLSLSLSLSRARWLAHTLTHAAHRHVDTLCNYGALLKTIHAEYDTAQQVLFTAHLSMLAFSAP